MNHHPNSSLLTSDRYSLSPRRDLVRKKKPDRQEDNARLLQNMNFNPSMYGMLLFRFYAFQISNVDGLSFVRVCAFRFQCTAPPRYDVM